MHESEVEETLNQLLAVIHYNDNKGVDLEKFCSKFKINYKELEERVRLETILFQKWIENGKMFVNARH